MRRLGTITLTALAVVGSFAATAVATPATRVRPETTLTIAPAIERVHHKCSFSCARDRYGWHNYSNAQCRREPCQPAQYYAPPPPPVYYEPPRDRCMRFQYGRWVNICRY